jgi:hypothetical protein
LETGVISWSNSVDPADNKILFFKLSNMQEKVSAVPDSLGKKNSDKHLSVTNFVQFAANLPKESKVL